MVGVKQAPPDQHGVGGIRVVVLHVTLDPALRTGTDTRIILDDLVGMIIRIHGPAELELFHWAEADGLLPFGFRARHRRQKQAGENGDDGNDHQQLDECERDAGVLPPRKPAWDPEFIFRTP
jgi:hypothetical protein